MYVCMYVYIYIYIYIFQLHAPQVMRAALTARLVLPLRVRTRVFCERYLCLMRGPGKSPN